MKKTSKLFGAIALSAALAMGTAVPALAAPIAGSIDDIEEQEGDTTELTVDEDLNAGTKDTVVSVTTHTSQISVTIPMTLPVVADTAGGLGKAPNNYAITNNSVPDIEIAGASWAIEEGMRGVWNLSNAAMEDAAAPVTKHVDADGMTNQDPSMGSLYLSLMPGTWDADAQEWTDADKVDALGIGAATTVQSKKEVITSTLASKQDDLGWVIKGSGNASKAVDQTQQLHVTASSSIIAGEQKVSADVIKITYTVKLA